MFNNMKKRKKQKQQTLILSLVGMIFSFLQTIWLHKAIMDKKGED
ncbi:hypothetical protein EV207_10257 [Scopulibacillus darangshiensis]|uniref:Uncharacterized protein n=1 Tax=Scopulibacillus darangshiensis TaxID=442528 RepID=A0A4R2PB02_9BACL|nr:hypothetical protein [Scopulibacillus darangshiensis]TCP31568.1 hypothetical protein EV207_10257 [Scopulibacillus darangshiensis]